MAADRSKDGTCFRKPLPLCKWFSVLRKWSLNSSGVENGGWLQTAENQVTKIQWKWFSVLQGSYLCCLVLCRLPPATIIFNTGWHLTSTIISKKTENRTKSTIIFETLKTTYIYFSLLPGFGPLPQFSTGGFSKHLTGWEPGLERTEERTEKTRESCDEFEATCGSQRAWCTIAIAAAAL